MKEWLEKAEKDSRAAKKLASDEQLWELACFHCHQAAEKSLKAFLVFNKGKLPRIHDLETLAAMCAEIDKDFGRFADDAIFLNPFYIISRYPSAASDVSMDIVHAALVAADTIIAEVRRKIEKQAQ